MKLKLKNYFLDLSTPKIMGILNATPDSFYSKSRKKKIASAINYVEKMIKSGADIIDIGGESTRPGALKITVQEEMDRVLPILEEIKKRFNICISVDTSNANVIYEASNLGAHIINDVRALKKSGTMEAIKKTGLSVCLMHMQGTPRCMQKKPFYKNILHDIKKFLKKKYCYVKK